MLTIDEQQEIETEYPRYATKQGACVEALKIVQRRCGWVSDEDVKDVAAFLDMPYEELEGVATFYNLVFRQPVGKHIILICDNVSCWITGYRTIRNALVARLGIELGETTADGRFTLLPIPCLGACDHAPAMMVGHDLHGDLQVEQIDAILRQYG
ncbi:NADH-quinone oxidoreductase subunit NuoE [Acidiferrobacter thiooxydans]